MSERPYTRTDQPYVLPDWAPKDSGSILVQDGDWVLVKDYYVKTRKPMTTAIHLCDGRPWEMRHLPACLTNEDECSECKAKPPAAFLGFCRMVEWKR